MAETSQRSVWRVRDVDIETKRRVRVYAAEHDLTIAQALAELTTIAFSK